MAKLNSRKIKEICSQCVLKDNDLDALLKFKEPDLLNLSLNEKRRIMIALKADLGFLLRNNLVDYSLLLLVEDTKHKKQKTRSTIN